MEEIVQAGGGRVGTKTTMTEFAAGFFSDAFAFPDACACPGAPACPILQAFEPQVL